MKMEKNKQSLPPKENSLFKRILRCYEQKQYKNGLKFAKLILTNFPDHGETLAMKGLTLNCLGKKEEAYNYVRQGLRNNLSSHVCWHVYGLLQRSDKKYEEAIKCYRNALKWDRDNLQILRDLSLLQIQMRDLEGYKETRYKLFDLRPTQRASWIGYAMSFHLLKDYETALKIIEEFRKTFQVSRKGPYDYEYSELLLYQNLVLRESGKKEEALKHLTTYQGNICDKVTLGELKGELLVDLGREAEATEVYRALISRNPENKAYYLHLENCLGLVDEEEKLKFYEEFKEKYPRAHVPRRLPLNYATGPRLESLLGQYLINALRKGVPPLFTDIKGLYGDPEKVKLIERLMVGYIRRLHDTGFLTEGEKGTKEPACELYGLMFLAQHFSYLGDVPRALKLLHAAFDHTPTLIELYILKGTILKHAGDFVGACESLKEAQSLDTADRYVNSKAASALLRAGRVSEAEDMCAKFTREGVSAMDNLNEMQCMWFQTECAEAYTRHGSYGLALKKCHEIDRHFTEITEDQFDFHTYCMRKMTLRSYVQLLRLEDVLRGSPFYWDAALVAIRIYLRLYDQPTIENHTENVDTSNMTASEIKRFKAKQRKAQRKADLERQEEEKKVASEHPNRQHRNKNNQHSDGDSSPADELVPSKLERPEDPLAEAIKFLQPLQTLASERIVTHIVAFEIYWRRSKPLIMLQSLKRALVIDPHYPDLHPCVVKFLQLRKTCPFAGPISEVVDRELSRFLPSLEPVRVNEDYLNRFCSSAPHRLQAALAMLSVDPLQRERAIGIATALDDTLEGKTLEHCSCVLEQLESPTGVFLGTAEEVLRFKSAANKLFPYALAFLHPDISSNNIEASAPVDGTSLATNRSDCAGGATDVNAPTNDDVSETSNDTEIPPLVPAHLPQGPLTEEYVSAAILAALPPLS